MLPPLGPCLSKRSLSQGWTPIPSMQHSKSLVSLNLKTAMIPMASYQEEIFFSNCELNFNWASFSPQLISISVGSFVTPAN